MKAAAAYPLGTKVTTPDGQGEVVHVHDFHQKSPRKASVYIYGVSIGGEERGPYLERQLEGTNVLKRGLRVKVVGSERTCGTVTEVTALAVRVLLGDGSYKEYSRDQLERIPVSTNLVGYLIVQRDGLTYPLKGAERKRVREEAKAVQAAGRLPESLIGV